MRPWASVAAAGVLALCAAPASAETPPPSWQFSVTPYIWLPALSGSLETPLPRIGDPGFDIGSGTVLTNLARVPVMLAGEVRYGRFALFGDFVYAGVEQDINTRRVAFQDGHTILDSTFGTLLGMVRAVETPTQSFDLGAGTRVWNFGTKISLNPGLAPGAIRKTSLSWADPLLAARYAATLSPQFGVSLYGDIGGFSAGSRLTWQALGSLDYHLAAGTTLHAGWRYVFVDRERGSYGVNVGFNGPFFGATFRF